MDPVFALIVAGGAALYSYSQRGQAHSRWKGILNEAAQRLGGRVSAGTRFDTPELRAKVDGTTITIKLSQIHKAPKKGLAVAEADLATETSVRLYLGWDVDKLPTNIQHIPPIPYPKAFGLTGQLEVRADDAAVAARFAEEAVTDLVDLRRESRAHAIEILIRGSSVRVAVHGIQTTAGMVERLVRVTARFAHDALISVGLPVPSVDRGDDPLRFRTAEEAVRNEDNFPEMSCTLCSEDRAKRERWVNCARCNAHYHKHCWDQAAGCLKDDCPETHGIEA